MQCFTLILDLRAPRLGAPRLRAARLRIPLLRAPRLRAVALRAAALLAASWLAAPVAAFAAARLEAGGTHLSTRRLESLFAVPLRAPGDAGALSGALSTLLAELQETGHLDARASAAWDSAAPVLRLSVDEGPRYRMTELAIDAPSREDSAAFAALLEIDPSGWMAPAALARAIERAVRRAADQGYPYATLGVSRMRWDSAGARVRLSGALGPAVTVSGIRIDGLRATRQKTAEQAMGPLVDRPFSEAAAASARERLARLGLFRAVEYLGLQSESDFRRARLVYQVEEPRYNRFEGAAGLQTEGQVVGLASIALDNLAGTGRALGLRWESSGRGIADFHARYAEPTLLGAPLTATLAAEHHDQDTIYTRTRWGAEVRYALSEHNRIAAGYAQERAVQTQADPQSASTQVTEFTVERDGRDRPAAPRRGSLGRLTAEQAFRGEILRSGARRNIRTSAVEGLVDWHRPLGARSGLSLELSGAGRFSPERVLPLFDRYPVGGAASLRGHDEQAYLVDRYGLSRLEWRRFLGDRGERVFLFWDHAIMGTTVLLPDDSADLQVLQKDGIGFGLRLDAAGGTVGVDYGLEPGRSPLEGKIHLRLVSTF